MGAAWVALAFIPFMAVVSGCSGNSPKSRYVLAEKLWTDGRYSAAVAEFERVIARDPQGGLGLQALFRAANTQALFLHQYEEAVRKFRLYIERSSDPDMIWEAYKQIGDILYSRSERYDAAISHYNELVTAYPKAAELAEYRFRIARAHFLLGRWDHAISSYQDLIRLHPKDPWSERAAFEIGMTDFTRGGPEACQRAIKTLNQFVIEHPRSQWRSEAEFGVAGCLEELDQLDAAYERYERIKSTYPSPKVIQIKMIRIRQRQTQKQR